MFDYFSTIQYLLINKPKKHTLIFNENIPFVINMIDMHIKNKCNYTVNIEKIGKCFEYITNVIFEMEWFDD